MAIADLTPEQLFGQAFDATTGAVRTTGASGGAGSATITGPLGSQSAANSVSVVLSSDGPFTASIAGTLTDASIASATGASQTIAALSTTRTTLNISNPGTTTWWINETGGTAAANAAGCFELPPGARWTPRPTPRNAVTGIGTAASKLSVVTG